MYIHSQILLRLPDRLCSEPGVAFVHGLQVHRLIGPCPNKKLTETANQNKGTTRPVPAKEVEDEQDAGVAPSCHVHVLGVLEVKTSNLRAETKTRLIINTGKAKRQRSDEPRNPQAHTTGKPGKVRV